MNMPFGEGMASSRIEMSTLRLAVSLQQIVVFSTRRGWLVDVRIRMTFAQSRSEWFTKSRYRKVASLHDSKISLRNSCNTGK
jgi:hypothetical protein